MRESTLPLLDLFLICSPENLAQSINANADHLYHNFDCLCRLTSGDPPISGPDRLVSHAVYDALLVYTDSLVIKFYSNNAKSLIMHL